MYLALIYRVDSQHSYISILNLTVVDTSPHAISMKKQYRMAVSLFRLFSNMHLPLIGLQDLTCGMNLIERLLSHEDLAKSEIALAVGDLVTEMI